MSYNNRSPDLLIENCQQNAAKSLPNKCGKVLTTMSILTHGRL
ncbi:hypothetical protein BBC0244_017320 [Bartonella apihabitans]|nr:hypothetical protein [Bartonella apihabitans]AQT45411.1 hypothetical protein BBC0244_017320 [Bartonella apihabitans]